MIDQILLFELLIILLSSVPAPEQIQQEDLFTSNSTKVVP